ncbi:hypothetical protein FGO68_gene16101 [Halteria grandinella]|uniref:Uncharacterized protein n=1 Tax=Halteria grandinella TaxID=5974 RepID=A0A8J8NWR1_HALGN|nr:hypothetical protein FGO68_gene16101 [Halteria grandinella]
MSRNPLSNIVDRYTSSQAQKYPHIEIRSSLKLGKLRSKYLIFEIFSYSLNFKTACKHIHGVALGARELLIHNGKWIKILWPIQIKQETITIKSISQLQGLPRGHPIFDEKLLFVNLSTEDFVFIEQDQALREAFSKKAYRLKIDKVHLERENLFEVLDQMPESANKYFINKLTLQSLKAIPYIYSLVNLVNFGCIEIAINLTQSIGASQDIQDLEVIKVSKLILRGISISDLPQFLKYVMPKQNGFLQLWPDKITPQCLIECYQTLFCFDINLSRFEIGGQKMSPKLLKPFSEMKFANYQGLKLRVIDKQFSQLLASHIQDQSQEGKSVLKNIFFKDSHQEVELDEFLMNHGKLKGLKIPKIEITLSCLKAHPKLNQHDLLQPCLEYEGCIGITGVDNLHSYQIGSAKNTDNNYLGVMACLVLRNYPNLRGFQLTEEFNGGTMCPVADGLMEQIRPQNLLELTINMQSHKNDVFYRKLLTVTKDKLQMLKIVVDHDASFYSSSYAWRQDPLIDVIENSQQITSFEGQGNYYLIRREISVFGTLPSLRILTLCHYDYEAMQELLEREFTGLLQNLIHLALHDHLLLPERALSGPHKSLMHLKYGYRNQSSKLAFNLAQTLAIVQGKKYGFKFTSGFEDTIEFQARCPTAILIDIRNNQ